MNASELPLAAVLPFLRCVTLLLGPGRLLLDHIAANGSMTAMPPITTLVIQSQLRLMGLLEKQLAQCGPSVRDEWMAQLAPAPAVVAWLEAGATAIVGLPPPVSSHAGAFAATVGRLSASVALLSVLRQGAHDSFALLCG